MDCAHMYPSLAYCPVAPQPGSEQGPHSWEQQGGQGLISTVSLQDLCPTMRRSGGSCGGSRSAPCGTSGWGRAPCPRRCSRRLSTWWRCWQSSKVTWVLSLLALWQTEDTREPRRTRVAPELFAGPGVGDPCREGLRSSPIPPRSCKDVLQPQLKGQEGDSALNWCHNRGTFPAKGTGIGN